MLLSGVVEGVLQVMHRFLEGYKKGLLSVNALAFLEFQLPSS